MLPLIFVLGFGALLLYAAWSDIKKREVDDLVTVIAWAGYAIYTPEAKLLLIGFIVVWALGIILERWQKVEVLGWGDVLWMPIFFAYLAWFFDVTTAFYLSLGAILAAQVYLAFLLHMQKDKRKKVRGAALVAFMALIYFGYLVKVAIGV